MVTASRFACIVLMTSPIVAGCTRPPAEPRFAQEVTEQLKAAGLTAVTATWQQSDHAIHLAGLVRTPGERTQAESVAVAHVGTLARIVNDVQVSAPLDPAPGIEAALQRLSEADKRWVQDTRGVQLHVEHGVVTVSGRVPSSGVRQRVVARVRQVPGVTDVVDKLDVVRRSKKVRSARVRHVSNRPVLLPDAHVEGASRIPTDAHVERTRSHTTMPDTWTSPDSTQARLDAGMMVPPPAARRYLTVWRVAPMRGRPYGAGR